MTTATTSHMDGFGRAENLCDGRITAFCSSHYPDLFHAFAYANDIWKDDPFDVESIHRNARQKFQRIVSRVLEPSGLPTGRILLLLGESGCGKTHLMRAFPKPGPFPDHGVLRVPSDVRLYGSIPSVRAWQFG